MGRLLKRLALVVSGLVVAAGVACSGDPAPTPVPASDIAAMVRDAVAEGQTSAADIQKIVDDALMAAPQGVTAEQLKAQLDSATAGQLSASEVQSIVDRSIRALPAPEIDVSALNAMVMSAVAEAAPEGVSAAEITRIVQQQVASGLAGTLTRGDIEDLVASAVTDAVGDQLSAEDVQGIIDASLMATNQAIEEAAMAAQSAQMTAMEIQEQQQMQQAMMGSMMPDSCYIRGDLVTDCPPKGTSRFEATTTHRPGTPWLYHSAYSGPPPTEFYESPLSAQMVKAGTIPPLDERLPVAEDVSVVLGPDGIGEYGGAYRITEIRSYTGEWIAFGFVQRDSDEINFGPGAGKSWEASEDGKEYTYTLRRGLKWDDGTPLTVEDVRFAFEDHNFNKDLNPNVPAQMVDPVTGDPVEFSVVDDLNFKLTFDSPNWILMEQTLTQSLCMLNRFCWFTHPNMRKLHPKYTEAAALQARADALGLADWKQVYHQSQNAQLARFSLEAFEDIGSTGCIAPYCFVEYKEGEIAVAERNHYFPFVDPAGNQLPYTDQVVMLILPGDEATVRFRSMNGETDGRTTNYVLSEVPLYIQNMQEGDYSLYGWPALGGADLGLELNQTYNADPEIGRLLRTKDFRLALSHAIDRDAINETVQLGFGVIQNRVPHPSTPYNPGVEFRQLHIPADKKADTAKANELLDGIGLTGRDSDGFRTLPNGDRVSINFVFSDSHGRPAVAELAKSYLEDVGIEMTYTAGGQWWVPFRNMEECCSINTNLSRHTVNPWMRFRTNFIPFHEVYFAPGMAIARYYRTAGSEGMAPGSDPAYLPMASPDQFPADHMGWFQSLYEDTIAGYAYQTFDPRRVELGKNMYRNHSENMLAVHVSAFSNAHIGIFLNRNNMRNQPFTHAQDHNGHTGWAYYFDGGRDNYNNPGNRSQFCQSWAFTQGGRQQCE